MEDKSKQRIDLKDLAYLRDRESWSGSGYEPALAAPIGTLDGPTRLHILSVLQREPHISGLTIDRDKIEFRWPALDETAAYYPGVVHVPDKGTIGCRLTFIDNDFEAWCLLYIPMGMLGLIYPVEYPVEVTSDWIAELDPLLAGIAARLYGSWPFVYGGLGEEASAMLPTAERISGKV